MDNYSDIYNKYSIKQDKFLNKLCAPLKDYLGITIFGYYYIEKDGSFGNISTYYEQVSFFYEVNLHLTHPYLAHPHLFRSGYDIIPITNDPSMSDTMWNKYSYKDLFLILHRQEDSVEGFMFAKHGCSNYTITLNYLNVLNKFTHHFKREAHSLIHRMKSEKYNLKKAKGEAFFAQDPSIALSNLDSNELKFLNALCPLTSRERQCLDLFQQGKSAQATAAILGLSPRTIEFYFDNIKQKLGCTSKWDLLNF